jgi:hypothetical protein
VTGGRGVIIYYIMQSVAGGQCVIIFGYCRVLQEGQKVIIKWIFYSVTGGTDCDNNLDITIRKEKSASFSLNIVLDIFRITPH